MGSIAGWLLEGYIEFGVGVFVILLRIFTRSRLLGIKRWQGDDYLILVALAAYGLQAYLWKGLQDTSSINHIKDTSKEEIETLAHSLKVNLALWTCNITYLWCLKGCMIALYSRLTNGLIQYRFIRITSIVIAATWILSILELYLHCFPLQRLWQITPNPGLLCSSDLTNFAIVGFFNFITNAMLLCIVAPVIMKTHVLLVRRLFTGLLICGGIFVIAASLVRNIDGILQIFDMGTNDTSSSMRWAVRELLVATIVVNAPCIKSLFCDQEWMSQRSGCSGEKRQPLDWDEAESQVMNARIGNNKESMHYQYIDTINSTTSWSSDGTLVSDKSPELYTYGLERKVSTKKVRFSDSPIVFTSPEDPARMIVDDDGHSNGIVEIYGSPVDIGVNRPYGDEEDLLPAPLRLLTVKNI